jgi:hypothetical protein
MSERGDYGDGSGRRAVPSLLTLAAVFAVITAVFVAVATLVAVAYVVTHLAPD